MDALSVGTKSYRVDAKGFLEDRDDWEEAFAEAMAPAAGIPDGLTDRHWQVIRYIRDEFTATGDCPLVFSTCRAAKLRLKDLKALFPTGYLRGACRLAGITYRDRFINYFGQSGTLDEATAAPPKAPARTYRVDVFGFLVDPAEWDEQWATHKARELDLPRGLEDAHWRVLRELRRSYMETGVVPTVIECCEANGLELDELEALFPGGYQRHAVKLAGLCVRPG
jgi:TusE/DsrC/DsvC family sulfur relay protein